MHRDRRHVRPRRHCGKRKLVVEVEVRTVRLVHERQHAARVRQLDNRLEVRTDTVIGRVVEQHRHRVRVLVHCAANVR
ncbi:hypothetical protein SDC9_116052 [bioreactor metagenome]|uniref:Uncharacterized protein n=1 Tax=bioreactor metagenome TaxID=1076179 RepID=A0A645BVJ7_9ZZZZ